MQTSGEHVGGVGVYVTAESARLSDIYGAKCRQLYAVAQHGAVTASPRANIIGCMQPLLISVRLFILLPKIFPELLEPVLLRCALIHDPRLGSPKAAQNSFLA